MHSYHRFVKMKKSKKVYITYLSWVDKYKAKQGLNLIIFR